jgi:ubiquitin fusion degradation protein 1
MEEANAIITSFIADHKPSDESLALSLQDLDAGSFSANFVVGPLTNEPLISFQIFFEQSWVPLFVMSDSKKLESWVPIIGRTLESTPEAQTLSGLLPRITSTLESHLAPPKPAKAAEEVEEVAFSPEQVEREIRAWARAHPRMRLVLTRLDRGDHIALFSLGHIKVQLYFKSNWHPLFFSTENSELNQHLIMANMLLSNHGYLKMQPKAVQKPAETETTTSAPAAESPSSDAPAPADTASSPAQMDVDPSKPETEGDKMDVTVTEATDETGAAEIKIAPSTSVPQPEIGLGRVFDLIMEGYKSQYQFDLEEDDLDDETDEEEENPDGDGDGENPAETPELREPTEDEWNTVVIPGIKRFMRREGMAPYLMDEWMRRVEQTKRNVSLFKALSLIRDELVGGGAIPKALRPFVPRSAYGSFGGGFDAPNAMPGVSSQLQEVQNFLSAQWSKLSRRLLPETGFYARPLKGDILHWTLNLFNFDANSPLGIALMQLALQHHTFEDAKPTQSSAPNMDTDDEIPAAPAYYAPKKKVEATQITIEVLFPESFDDEDAVPFFRVIRPTLINLPQDFFENVFKTFKPKPQSAKEEKDSSAGAGSTTSGFSLFDSADSSPAVSSIQPSYYAALANSSGGVSSGESESSTLTSGTGVMTTSTASAAPPASESPTVASVGATQAGSAPLEEGTAWKRRTFDLFDFCADLRLCLMTQSPQVDMNSALTGYQTTGFWKRFRCISAVMAEEEKIEGTGKVCLPASCLEMIYGGRVSVSLSMSGNIAPMTFELCGVESRVQTYCGVLEFTAQEGTVVVPSWMFQMLHFQEGEMVMLRQITLPPGDFVKLQPMTDSYAVEGINPKALLEWRLRDFVALTKGEILPIISHGHTFRFSVLDVRPGHAIAITDRDITVEFVDPLETTSAEATDGKLVTQPSDRSTAPNSANGGTSESPLPNKVKSPLRTGHAEATEVVDGKKCDNCRHMIPEAAFLTHSMRCPRMNYFCEACQTAVPKADKEAHDATIHAPTECGRCHEKMEVRHLANHAQNLCKARIVKCAYCELNMPAEALESHESACGSRTVKCTDCNARVSVRFLEEHQASGCVRKEEPRRYGSPSTNTRGETSPYGANSQIFVCETCKAPIDSFDELQVHMLTVHYSEDLGSAMDTSGAADSATKPEE